MWRSGLMLILLTGGILAQQALNCNHEDVLMKCKNNRNGGHTYFNQGSEWDPEVALRDWHTSNQEDCHPCCKDPNTSIDKCPETDLPDENGESWDQLREPFGVRGWLVGNSRGTLNKDLHCPRHSSSQKCRRGSGMRIYNR